MPHKTSEGTKIKVAIIGGGPAGLGTAIEINKLPFVDWTLYEKSEAIKEIGAGISIQQCTWRMLQVMGAAKNISTDDFFRPFDLHHTQHRNGHNGELLACQYERGLPLSEAHGRAHRAVLQNALLKEVDQSHIRLSSRLIDVQHDAFGKAIIIFEDGYRDTVDLVIGADGIRSVVRTRAFPSYPITYTGRISYRTLISAQAVASQTSIPDAVTFWHGKNGVWVYTCPLNNNLFEITTMAREPPEGKDRVSWGQEATIQQMTDHYRDFHPQILKVLSIPTHVQQYAAFAGPRLSTVISSSPFSTALIGDASHPLSGAFGSGAGFALEDGWTIAQSLLWAHRNNKGLDEALKLFDEVRSPHYRALYDVMDSFAKAEGELQAKQSSGEIVGVDEEISFRVAANWSEEHVWMHHYDIQSAFRKAVAAKEVESQETSIANLETSKLGNTNTKDLIHVAVESVPDAEATH